MDDERITEILEHVAPEIQAESLVKEDDQKLWYVELPDDVRVTLNCCADERKLVCSLSVVPLAS